MIRRELVQRALAGEVIGDGREQISALTKEVEALRSSLEACVFQYGFVIHGLLTSGGMSCLEDAMEVLGMDDPCPAPMELVCDVPDCGDPATCGWPSGKTYRHTCGHHYHKPRKAKNRDRAAGED